MSSEALTFEDIQRRVEQEYPRVIAGVFKKCRVEKTEDVGGQHKNLIDLFEVLLRFLCVVELQECRTKLSNLKARLPQKEKTLEFLERPSTGGWMSLLRTLSKLDLKDQSVPWTNQISTWFNDKNTRSRKIVEKMDSVSGVTANKKSSSHNAEILNALVNYRNKKFAHSAKPGRSQLKEQVYLLEEVLVYLLDQASFLSEMGLWHIERAEIAKGDGWGIHGKQLNGITEEPVHLRSQSEPTLEEVYVGRAEAGEVVGEPISLSPFIVRQPNRDTGEEELFVYNSARRTMLEYISYESGAHYHHEGLHSDFEKLIDLELVSDTEKPDQYQDLSAEEKREYASRFYKRAKQHEEAGRYEDAIQMLEQSIKYDRRPDTFLEMARLQHQLGDPDEAVLQTLQDALEIKPDFEEAQQFRRVVQSSDDDAAEEVEAQTSDKESSELKYEPDEKLSFVQAVTPPKIREYAKLISLVGLILWYSASGGIEYYYEGTQGLIERGLHFALCGVMLVGVTGKDIMMNLRTPLSLQLDNMRLERFQEWFEEKIEQVWGRYRFRPDGWIDVGETVKREPVFYSTGLIIVLAFSVYSVYMTNGVEGAIVLKRVVDWSLVYTALWMGIRASVMATVFVLEFSSLSLKPSLTKMEEEGVMAMGPFIVFVIIQSSVAYILILAIFYNVLDANGYIGVLVFGAGFLTYLTWSIGLPVSVHYAMVKSKRKVVNKYVENIEERFYNFVEEPNENSLEKYEWIMDKRSVVNNVATWPLGKIQAMTVVVFNIMVSYSFMWYVEISTNLDIKVQEYVRYVYRLFA
jgi:tetratricopeptide (TPR) repeat protein